MIVKRDDSFVIRHDWAPNIVSSIELNFHYVGADEYDLIRSASRPAGSGWLEPRYGQKRVFGDTAGPTSDDITSTFTISFSSRRVSR